MKRLAQGYVLALALFLMFPKLASVCTADTGVAHAGIPSPASLEPFSPGVDGTPPVTASQDEFAPTCGGSEPMAQTAPSIPNVCDSGEPPAIGCSTAEELLLRLRDEPGGTIDLTSDIEWDFYSRVTIDKATTVRMGDYGIHIADGGVLWLEGPIRFEGSGAIKPLFTAEGQFFANDGAQIAAQGDGAIAVRIIGYGGANLSGSQVSAEGDGAVAVRAENEAPYFPAQTDFLASGAGSRAIEADGPVEAFLCRIRSEGGEAVVSGGEIQLLGCTVEPSPTGAAERTLTAVLGYRAEQNGICLPVGAGTDDLEAALENISIYVLFDGQGGVYQFPAPAGSHWEGLPKALSAAGSHMACLIPGKLPAWFPLELPVSHVPIHLVDPSQPFLASAEKSGENVSITTYDSIGDAHSLRLVYSTDGVKWADAPIPPEFEPLSPEGGTVGPLEEGRAYYFRLEVEGGPMAGRSNTLKYLHTDFPEPESGGDLDGGDRDDQGDLPPADEIPPPEPEPTPEPDPPLVNDPQVGAPEYGTDGGRESGRISITRPAPAPPPEPVPSPTPSSPLTPPPEASPPQPPEAIPTAGGGPEETPSAPSPAGSDIPAEATIALTAAELADQLEANPTGLTLLGGGLKVYLPAGLLEGWGGSLAARLDRPVSDAFEVRFWADGVELDGFADGTYIVTVPVDGAADMEHFCMSPDGEEIAASGVAGGRADFALTETGLYTLSTSAVPAAASPDARPQSGYAPMLAVGALLAGAAGLMLFRRRGKR